MILLQVKVGHVTADEGMRLMARFGKWYDPETGEVQYPVSCDSHGFDVFHDEFEEVGTGVDSAAIVDMPYGYDAFVPFTEESAGTALYELGGEPDEGWIVP